MIDSCAVSGDEVEEEADWVPERAADVSCCEAESLVEDRPTSEGSPVAVDGAGCTCDNGSEF